MVAVAIALPWVLAVMPVEAEGASGNAAASKVKLSKKTSKKSSKKLAKCDPNYSACVPIASDVDCKPGSGDGPKYFTGTAKVLKKDIYRLDRDKDGLACEKN